METVEMLFAFMVVPAQTEQEAIILVESIRTFAGQFADSPIWALVPMGMGDLSPTTQARFEASNVTLLPFPIAEDSRGFPFAAKVQAAAAAERQAKSRTNNLVWVDVDSIVIQQPDVMILQDEQLVGYRPVDHRLIGSLAHEPLDDFWALIYEKCQVRSDHIFNMKTSVDEQLIRPYFNAGMLVVRPASAFLQAWETDFLNLFLQPCFQRFYEKDMLYRIFMHQAVLAGTILRTFKKLSLQLLSWRVNYPLHMHGSYPPAIRPTTINELVSCRYDTFFQNDNWRENLSADEPLRGWILEHVRN
jgi:hypothetical protein